MCMQSKISDLCCIVFAGGWAAARRRQAIAAAWHTLAPTWHAAGPVRQLRQHLPCCNFPEINDV